MKKIIFALLISLCSTVAFSQTAMPKPVIAGKILLNSGQKITASTTISIEADLSMGMELNSNSTSENTLEVKNNTERNYTITSTLTKLKVNFNMMGQATNYDSEKNQVPSTDVEKSFAERLNKPVDVILDNTTGLASIKEEKKDEKDADNANPMEGMLKMFAQSSDDAVVAGAFELIPQGKNTGDTWSDTTKEKDMKTIRNYTLKSITGSDALIQLDIITTATNKMDMQGMEFEFKSTTKTSGEITTDINNGQVKNKTTKSEITGSIQLMGQDVPISATVNSASTYK